MIGGLDDILDSDRVFGSDAPSDRDDLRLGMDHRLGWTMAQMTSSTRIESLARMHPQTEIVDGLDDILDSDGVFGWDAPSDRDSRWLG
jgi:hypothetical protein